MPPLPPLPPSTRTRTAHLTVRFFAAIVRTRPDSRLQRPSIRRPNHHSVLQETSVWIARLSKSDRGSPRSLPLSKNGTRQNDAIHSTATFSKLEPQAVGFCLPQRCATQQNSVFCDSRTGSHGLTKASSCLGELPSFLWSFENSHSLPTAARLLWLDYMAKSNLHPELPFPLFSIVTHDEVPRLL